MPITDGLMRHARLTPERTAVALASSRCSYGDLAGVVRGVAQAVRDTLAGTGRVGLLLEPGLEFLEVFLGTAAAGSAAMVLDPAWSPAELERVLASSPPDLVLSEPPPPGPARPLPHVPDDAPFYIGFTSGTTAHPKGFVRHHRSWLRSFDASAAVYGIGDDDHILAPGPLSHSLFLYAAVHGIWAGATVHLRERFDAAGVLACLRAEPVTRIYLVPTMLSAVVHAAARQRFGRVRSVILSGARCAPGLKARACEVFPGAEVVEFYGASELSFVSTVSSRDGAPEDSVGRPFPGVELSIRGPGGAELGPAEVGRLYVRSEMVFSGYLRQEDTGAERDAEGWVTVGDLAWRDRDGYLYLAGRERNMLITGGRNVYPEQVEHALRGLPEVAEVAVVGLPDRYWGELVCAVIRWTDDRRLSPRALREHCRATLPRHAWPRRYVEVGAFPYTPSGKIARPQLMDALRSAQAQRS